MVTRATQSVGERYAKNSNTSCSIELLLRIQMHHTLIAAASVEAASSIFSRSVSHSVSHSVSSLLVAVITDIPKCK